MAKNTDKLYEALKGFQDSRKDITDVYAERLKQLEATKGSEYYQTESNKLKNLMNGSLNNKREEYGARIDSILKDMKTVNESRKLTAPTTEQLNLINALKMRENVSLNELKEAANACVGCPTALGIINDLAMQFGYVERFKGATNTMSIDGAGKQLNSLLKDIQDFLRYDTSKASRIYVDYVGRHYALNPKTAKRPLFDTKEACFSEVCGLSGDALTAFEDAVDGTDTD